MGHRVCYQNDVNQKVYKSMGFDIKRNVYIWIFKDFFLHREILVNVTKTFNSKRFHHSIKHHSIQQEEHLCGELREYFL